MEKHVHRPVDGASCAVDRSCCGETEAVAGGEPSRTLAPLEMPERIARWKAMFATTQDRERTAGAAVFHFDDTPHSRSELEVLVALERKCCGHVSWHVSRRRGGVSNRLTLTLKSDEQSLQSILKRLLPPYPRPKERATR